MPARTNTRDPAAVERDVLIRRPEVERQTTIGKSQLYKLVRERKFPAPVRTGSRAVAWSQQAVSSWIEARKDGATTAANG